MRAKDVYYLRGERDGYHCVERRPKMMNDHRRLREATATTERRCGPRGQVQCGEVRLEWGTGRSSCEPESTQPAILCTHGSGRARGERAERGPWAGAQSLQYVVSSISCARRPRGVVRLRSPMVLSTHGSGRARCERAEQGAWAGRHAGRHASQAKMPLLSCAGVSAGEQTASARAVRV